MPLTPPPQDYERLDFTQQQVVVQQWEQECDDPSLGPPLERVVLVGNDDDDTLDIGSPVHAIELVVVEELRELIDTLQKLEPWLMQVGDGTEPCNWIVTTQYVTGDIESRGPFTKTAADAWADMQTQLARAETVAVTQLQRPPIV